MKSNKLGSLAFILIVGLTMSTATSPIYSAPTESIASLSPAAMEADVNVSVDARGVLGAAVAGALAGSVAVGPVGAAAGAAVGAVGNVVNQLWPFAEMAPATTPAELLD